MPRVLIRNHDMSYRQKAVAPSAQLDEASELSNIAWPAAVQEQRPVFRPFGHGEVPVPSLGKVEAAGG